LRVSWSKTMSIAEGGQRTSRLVRSCHEILFSLNLAFIITSLLYFYDFFSRAFIRVEVSSNALLGIRQTDLIRGYFAIWIPSILIAMGVWLLLRGFSRTKVVSILLFQSAGFVSLCGTAIFWYYLNLKFGWVFDARFWAGFLELPVALVCVGLFLNRRFRLPWFYGVLLLAAHFAFWFWILGNVTLASYIGPMGPIVGLCSSVAWAACVNVVSSPSAPALVS
jgi:hypothetical protein